MGMAFFFCLRESGSRRLFLTSPTGFAKMWDSNTGNDRSVRSCFGAAQLLLIFTKEKRKK